jgi:hypothetical protein
MSMKASELTLVRGGKLPKQALHWLSEVEKHFPGATKDIIVVRQKPISSLPRGDERGISTQREKV